MKRIMRTLAISLGVSGVLAVAPHEAAAQEANGLGEKGELIITVDRLMPLFSYSNESVTNTQGGQDTKTSDSSTSIALLFGREPSLTLNPHTIPRVAIDFTVINHLTIGGAFVLGIGLGGSHTTEVGNNSQKTDAPKITAVGFAPRVGYVLPLGHTFGFWPRAGFAFYSLSAKQDNTGNNGNTTTTTNSDSVWSLDLDPQFVWVAAPALLRPLRAAAQHPVRRLAVDRDRQRRHDQHDQERPLHLPLRPLGGPRRVVRSLTLRAIQGGAWPHTPRPCADGPRAWQSCAA